MYDIQTIGAINKNTKARTHEIQTILGEETYESNTVKGKLDQIIAATNKTKVDKTVYPKETRQIITANNDDEVLSSVVVQPVTNQNLTVSATLDGLGHTITAETDSWYKTVTVNPIQIVTQSIVPSNETQNIYAPDGACYIQFTVEPVPTTYLDVYGLSQENRTYTPESGRFYNTVIVHGEANLKAENIRKDVQFGTRSQGVVGTLAGWDLISSVYRNTQLLNSTVKTFSFADGLPELILLVYSSSNIGLYKFTNNTYTLVTNYGTRAMFLESSIEVDTTANTMSARSYSTSSCNMYYMYFK